MPYSTCRRDLNLNTISLQCLRSVKAFTDSFLERNLPLDLLVNNAGTAIMEDDTTEDGFEVHANSLLPHVMQTDTKGPSKAGATNMHNVVKQCSHA